MMNAYLPNKAECPECHKLITWTDRHSQHYLECPKCRYRKEIPLWVVTETIPKQFDGGRCK